MRRAGTLAGMNSTRIALIASIATVVLWAAKATAIGMAGGLDKSALESPLFALGFLCHIVAVVSLAVSWTRGRRILLRITAGLGAVVTAFLAAVLVGWGIGLLEPAAPGWVWGEINLWVLGLAVLGLVFLTRAGMPEDERVFA